ncbi:MAG: ATP-grasp domain-containing protein [Pyrinomonadaceae bacterium]
MNNHIVCIASYFKGNEFYEECAERGWRVTLVTHEKLLDEAWAWTSLSAVKTVGGEATQEDYIRVVTNIAGGDAIDKIVGIDEFDVLTAAKAREHLQIEGLSGSYLLRFRDKLRMRKTASAANLPCPEFVGAFNSKEIQNFLEIVPAPWIIKPRTEVNAFGIKKCERAEQVWETLNDFDARHTWRDHPSQFLIERFIEGKVFHVDSVVAGGRIVASGVSEYGQPPLKVSHQGGVFTTGTVAYKSKERRELEKLNKQLLKSFEYEKGIAHAEFLRSERDGKFYLLEVAARVGGAYIADVLEHASGLNLWREWAKLEIASKENPYQTPKLRQDYAAVALCLANTDAPDTSHYADKEIVYRVSKPRHAGLIFHAATRGRIDELLEIYTTRMAQDFLAVVPIKERHDV